MDDFPFYSKTCASLVEVILVASQAPHTLQVAFPIKHKNLSSLLKPNIKRFWVVQKNGSPKRQDQGHTRDVLLPQNVAAGVLKAWAAARGWVLLCTNITYISAHGIYSEPLGLACYTASQCSMHCSASHLFLMMFKDCLWESQKSVIRTFSTVGWNLNSFLTGDVKCLHFIAWHLLSGSYWWIQVSSPVTMQLRRYWHVY
jgi:hypothetical protein